MADINLNEFFANSDELFTVKPREKRPYDEVFSFETGQKYLIRLLPYVKEGKEGFQKTSFAFSQYAWRSCIDGRWTYVQSPRTYKEDCPISNWYFKAKDSTNPDVQSKVKSLNNNFRRYVYYNIYIVNDPVHPENNGKVKILRAGKQLDDVIRKALSKEASIIEEFRDELGVDNMRRAVFDLSENGINLCIDCQEQGGFPNYKSSRFVARKRDLGLSENEIKDILMKTYDLTTINRKFTTEEAAKIFTETFLGTNKALTSITQHGDMDEKPQTNSKPDNNQDLDETDLDSIERELAEEGWESSL